MLEIIGLRQQMIMQCIWDAKEAVTVNQIADKLEERQGERLSISTIHTLCVRLEKKGFLKKGEKIRSAFTYTACVTEAEFRKSEIERMRKYTFRDSSSTMIISMLDVKDLTNKDLEEIKKILKQYDKQQ